MEKEITIDLGRIFKAIIRKWWIIVICAVAMFGVVYMIIPEPVRTYTATTSVYGAVYGSYVETVQTNNLMYTYGSVASSKKVADRAATIIGRDDLTGAYIQSVTKVVTSKESPIIYFRATSLDPITAISIANAVADSFIVEAQSSIGTNSVQTLDRAETAKQNTGKGKMIYSLLGFLIGTVVAMIVIAIKEILSDKIYYVADAELGGELEILGVIPEIRHK